MIEWFGVWGKEREERTRSWCEWVGGRTSCRSSAPCDASKTTHGVVSRPRLLLLLLAEEALLLLLLRLRQMRGGKGRVRDRRWSRRGARPDRPTARASGRIRRRPRGARRARPPVARARRGRPSVGSAHRQCRCRRVDAGGRTGWDPAPTRRGCCRTRRSWWRTDRRSRRWWAAGPAAARGGRGRASRGRPATDGRRIIRGRRCRRSSSSLGSQPHELGYRDAYSADAVTSRAVGSLAYRRSRPRSSPSRHVDVTEVAHALRRAPHILPQVLLRLLALPSSSAAQRSK